MQSLYEVERSPSIAVSTPRPWRTSSTTNAEAFARLESAWRALGETNGGPIEQFDWAATVAGWGSRRPVEVVAVSRGEQLSALLPLELRRVNGVTRRTLLGVDELFEPMGLLAGDRPSRWRLITSLARSGWPCVFSRLVVDAASHRALRRAFGKHGWLHEGKPTAFPYLPLDASWCDPDTHLNSGRRSDLRRAYR